MVYVRSKVRQGKAVQTVRVLVPLAGKHSLPVVLRDREVSYPISQKHQEIQKSNRFPLLLSLPHQTKHVKALLDSRVSRHVSAFLPLDGNAVSLLTCCLFRPPFLPSLLPSFLSICYFYTQPTSRAVAKQNTLPSFTSAALHQSPFSYASLATAAAEFRCPPRSPTSVELPQPKERRATPGLGVSSPDPRIG